MTINFNLPEGVAVRVVTALESIAETLRRAVPPIPEERLGFRKRGIESVISYGDNSKLWKREQLGATVEELGMSPAEEKEYLEQIMDEEDERDQ